MDNMNSYIENNINKIQSERIEQYAKVQEEARTLFSKKNKDYGDAFAEYGVIGVLVRMGDKIQRLQSITTRKIQLVNDESLRDTLIDLHNYSAMAVMLLDDKDTCDSVNEYKELHHALTWG
jgi:hypothetical protein